MTIKVAINGYGRIGRNVLRAIYEANRQHEIKVVAINDLGDAETNAHLTQYDTAHGKFPGTVWAEGGDLIVNGDRIKVYAVRNPAEIPWGERGVDVVLDMVGGSYLPRNVSAAAAQGRIVQIGVMGGGPAEVNLGVVLMKRLQIIGTTLRNRPVEEKIAVCRRFATEVLPRFERGELAPVIDRRFPLAEIAAAHAYLAQNTSVGKVLIDVAW